MSDAIIQVDKVSKRYSLSHRREGNRGLRHILNDAFSFRGWQSLRSSRKPPEDFWALKDISLEVKRGEVVGIIGRNGAGKSTLLKILSRITEPTSGKIELTGRVASLLEVGTGFHPELTGRENVFLNGAILGMSRREIKGKFDEIVAFAEVERFLDTPVKWYSSGMYVRLAFAVAAHLEPEILIVDEVLAVGDVQFQKKCLGKMQAVSRNEGRTILFVSHNVSAVRALSTRAILLRNGSKALDADVETAIRFYIDFESCTPTICAWEKEGATDQGGFWLRRASILGKLGEPAGTVGHDESFTIQIEYVLDREISGLRVGFMIQNSGGVEICGSNDFHERAGDSRAAGNYISQCEIPGYLLNDGEYQLRFGAEAARGKVDILTPYCLSFAVEDTERHGETRHRLPGVVRPRVKWKISNGSSET